jgi:hypothetical protein
MESCVVLIKWHIKNEFSPWTQAPKVHHATTWKVPHAFSPEPSDCTGCMQTSWQNAFSPELSGPDRWIANKLVYFKLVLSSQQSQTWTTQACSLTHLFQHAATHLQFQLIFLQDRMVDQIVRTTVPHHPSLLQIKALYGMDAYLLINLGCNVTLQVSSSVPWSFYSYMLYMDVISGEKASMIISIFHREMSAL